jgi:hypothetical protein
MSLRQLYAGLAMKSIVLAALTDVGVMKAMEATASECGFKTTQAVIARISHDYADAMIAYEAESKENGSETDDKH